MSEIEFAEKVQNIKEKLYRTAYMYLGNEHEALDAVDESIYKGLKGLKKLGEPEFFTTWITRILINQCKNQLKQRGRYINYEDVPELSVVEFDSLPLKEAVLKLPKEIKEPLVLRYFGDFTVLETANALDIPQGTVATRVKRALKLLHLELGEEESLNE